MCKLKNIKGKEIVEIFINDVQHGYERELGPFLIGHYFWEKLNFPTILRNCGMNEQQVKTAEISVLNSTVQDKN